MRQFIYSFTRAFVRHLTREDVGHIQAGLYSTGWSWRLQRARSVCLICKPPPPTAERQTAVMGVCVCVCVCEYQSECPTSGYRNKPSSDNYLAGVGCKVVLSDATKTALRSTYERAIWLLPCCGLQRLTGVSGDSAAQMPYRLSRRGAQQLLSPSGRPGRTLMLQEGRWCGLATSAADHALRALVCLPIASRTDDEGIRRPRRLSPSCVCVCVCVSHNALAVGITVSTISSRRLINWRQSSLSRVHTADQLNWTELANSYGRHAALTFILIIISIPSPLLFRSRFKKFLFCKSFPPQPSFSSSGLTPRTVYRYFWAYPFFYFLVFPVFHVFVVGSVR